MRCHVLMVILWSFFPYDTFCKEGDSTVLEWVKTAQEFNKEGKYDSALFYIERAFEWVTPFESAAFGDSLALEIATYRAIFTFYSGEFIKGDSLFAGLLDFVRNTESPPVILAKVLLKWGGLKIILKEYESSRSLLEEALELNTTLHTELSEYVAEAHNLLGTLYWFARWNLAQSRRYFEKTLEIQKQILPEDDPQIAKSYFNLGSLAAFEEDYESAIQLIHSSFKINIPTNPSSQALIYNNLGELYGSMGNTLRALEYHQLCLEIRRKNLKENHPYIAHSYLNLGDAYKELGDFEEASANYAQYWNIIQKSYPDNGDKVAMSYQRKLGMLYISMGEFQEAERCFQLALNKYNKISPVNEFHNGDLQHFLGETHRELGNFDKAAWYFDQAHSIYRAHSAAPTSKGRLYKDKAILFTKQRRYAEALSEFDKGAQIYREIFQGKHPELALLLNEKAQTYLLQGNIKAAKRTYQEAISANLPEFSYTNINQVPPVKTPPLQAPIFLTSLHQKARLHSEEGSSKEWEVAIQLWDVAFHSLERMQAQTSYPSSKLDIRGLARDICEASIATQIKLFEATQDKKYLANAYLLAENSQTALLHEWIQELEARQQAGIPHEWVAKIQDLNSIISYYEKKIYEREVTGQKDSLGFSRSKKRLFRARNSRDSLVREMEKLYPQYYATKYQQRPLDLTSIQEDLRPSEQVIRYFLTGDKLYMFSLRQNELSYHSSKIDSTFYRDISRFYEFIEKNPAENLLSSENLYSYLGNAHNLFQQTIAPVIHKDTRKLYLIPDGRLYYLSFEALLTESVPQFSSFSELPFVLKSFEISYSYSTRLLFSSDGNTNPSDFKGFAPDYGNGSLPIASTRLVSSFDVDSLPPLLYNQPEVVRLQSLMQGQVFLGDEAREKTFKEEAPKAGILHMAMHALADDLNPLYSGLAFSQVDSSFDDNFLYTYELFNMQLDANLAVLSACNTGMGKIQKGEGMLSLAKGFQYAGCPNLVMSLWRTDDKAAFQLMQDFYVDLKAGYSYSRALRQAKLSYLASQDRSHPYYWANFLYNGQSNSPHQAPSIAWIIGLLGLLGAMGLFFWKKRKK